MLRLRKHRVPEEKRKERKGTKGSQKGRKRRCQHFSSYSVGIVRHPSEGNQSSSQEYQGCIRTASCPAQGKTPPHGFKKEKYFSSAPEGFRKEKSKVSEEKSFRLEQVVLLLPSVSLFLESP